MVDLHSPIKMRGKFSKKTVEWKDGKLYGDDDLVKEILSYADNIEKTGNPVFYQDVSFGHRNLLKTNITAYALACMVDEMELIGGKLPDVDEIFKDKGTPSKTTDGGPGSGNFGHSGRPGYVGGSGKGGGKAYRTGTKESGFVGIHKSKQFESIAMHASAHKDYHSFVSSLSNEQKDLLKQQHKDCGTKESLQQYTQRLHNMLSNRGKKPVLRSTAKIVEGKNIVRTFQRRKDKFPHEINDVINQQGFDGKPRIVNSDEFDQIIKDHPEMPVLFRSYSAPTQETLDAYDKQLEGGEWYVDCGTGGSQYGQGMYTAGVYDHKGRYDWSKANEEMKHYRQWSEQRIRLDDSNIAYRKTSNVVGTNPPKFMDCEFEPFKAYEVPQGADGWEEIDNAKLESGSIYCVKQDLRYKPLYGNGEHRYITMVADEGELHYLGYNGEVTSYSLDQLKEKGFVGVAKCRPVSKEEAEKFTPCSTTRRMTLDPTAKIISYKELAKERVRVEKENAKEFIESIKDPEPYIEDARKDYLSKLMPRNVDDEALNEIYGELRKTPEAMDVFYSWHGLKPWSSESKLKTSLAYFICGQAHDMAYGKESHPRTQKLREALGKIPAFQKEIDRLQEKCAKNAKSRWKSFIAENTWKYKEIPTLPFDDGVFAAMLGYDAINAEGHGMTGSYTVVLNRTKVILDKQPWEVD